MGPQGQRAPPPTRASVRRARTSCTRRRSSGSNLVMRALEPPALPTSIAAPSSPLLTPDEGGLAEQMGNLDDAILSYERALRTNPNSIAAMNSISSVLRTREDFPKAAEYLNAILKLDERNGEAWGCLGMPAGFPMRPSPSR